jgi:hypothetical protein
MFLSFVRCQAVLPDHFILPHQSIACQVISQPAPKAG